MVKERDIKKDLENTKSTYSYKAIGICEVTDKGFFVPEKVPWYCNNSFSPSVWLYYDNY